MRFLRVAHVGINHRNTQPKQQVLKSVKIHFKLPLSRIPKVQKSIDIGVYY